MPTSKFTMCLTTVPHTGTVFAERLLDQIGLPPHNSYTGMHWNPYPYVLPDEPKLLITARDPYLTALRFITEGDTIEPVALAFDNCIANLYNVDHYLLDIGCRETDRLEHVCNLARFLDIDPDLHMEKLVPFVEAWKPVNTTKEVLSRGLFAEGTENNKAEYLETGKLPNGYDWNVLDNAVTWYKSLPTNDYV